MMWIYYYISLTMIFMIIFLLSMMIYYLDMIIILEWSYLKFNSLDFKMYFIIDWMSLIFMSLILFISSFIMLYSMIYMKHDNFMKRFMYLLLMFILSMILMVVSPNMISILFGWDSLGVISYLLVLYYQNFISFNSGMVTILCNRIGDIGILMSLGLMMKEGFWSFMVYNSISNLIIFMVVIAALTKSAQIPFSIWLPLAMAAPTPISALVHSSTLVTAGVYLMIRFNKFLMDSCMNFYLLILSVLTMFMAGLMALLENDLKKIIALSTLSQLGFMMMILSLGFHILSFYHLMTHAIFKSLLFMSSGVIIHLVSNNQDIRLLGGIGLMMPFLTLSLYMSIMALMGMLFMSGFYSKDLMMELLMVLEMNPLIFFMIMITLMLTVIYSFRLFYYLFMGEIKFYSYKMVKESGLINFSMMMLMFLSVMVGSLLNWLFFYDYYMIYMKIFMKMLILEAMIMGMFLSFLMKFLILLKFYYLSLYLGSMWFLNFIYKEVYNPLNKMGSFMADIDKTWGEYMNKDILLYMKLFWDSMYFKMYMFMNMFIYGILVIYLMM